MFPTRFTLLVLTLACLAGCHAQTSACRIEGPRHLMPDKIMRVKLGMSKLELENVLGEADYSPSDGELYFSTGSDCPLEDTGRLAPCGVVAKFRDDRSGGDPVLTESLQSCWWGAIGE